MKNEKTVKLILIVSIVINIILLICLAVFGISSLKENKKVGTAIPIESGEGEGQHGYTQIRLDEDFSTDGTVKNIENVKWHNARITQHDNRMEVSIMLNNESQTERVESKNIKVNLLGKSGKVLYTKDVKMEEIAENYGYTNIELEFEINDIAVVYGVELIAQ